MSDPIDAKYRSEMNELARELDARFNPPPTSRRVGFALFVFEFGKTTGGQVNYISNGERADMIVAVKEWLARAEGRHSDGGRA